MHISADLYYSKEDLVETIERIIDLKEELDHTYDYRVLDEVVDILYELIEEAN